MRYGSAGELAAALEAALQESPESTAETEPSLELIRVGGRGSAVIDTSRRGVSLEDQAFHDIEFTRGADGVIVASVDGTELIRAVDRSFRDPFDGIVVANLGGDVTLREIAVYGSP
jgi:hypothetical protein